MVRALGWDTPSVNGSDISIVELQPDDWRALRVIRLEAFRTEPAAFSTTYAEALARPDEDWQARLASAQSVHFAAMSFGRVVGMAGAHLASDEGDPTVAVIFGMYVNAVYRGQGVGRLLLRTLIARLLAEPTIAAVQLWVRPGQLPARRLYESLGFRVIGEDDDGLGRELIMELRLRDTGVP